MQKVTTSNTSHMGVYMEYCAKYGKSYDNKKELMMRLKNFFDTDERLKQAMLTVDENNKGIKEEHKLRLAHNKFSDWTKAELAKRGGV
jgi:hypothetical protein